MRKAVVTEAKKFEIKERPIPEVGPEEVLIKVKYCGICSSEVHGGWTNDGNYPITTFGHEVAGEVKKIGSQVENIKVGMIVTGLFRSGFADYTVLKQDYVTIIPEQVNIKTAAAVSEPLSCIISAVRRLSLDPGDKAGVIGLGFMGLLQLKLLLLQGTALLVGVDIRSEALKQAGGRGADEVYFPDEIPKKYILNSWQQLGNNYGLDHVIEAAGTSEALDLAGEMVKIHKNLMILGYHQNGDRKVNINLWNWKAINIINGHERRKKIQLRCMQRGLDLLKNQRLNLDNIITHEYDFSDINTAFFEADTKPADYIKGIVKIN